MWRALTRTMLTIMVLISVLGQMNANQEKTLQIHLPSPDNPLSIKDATALYQSATLYISTCFRKGVPPYPLPEIYVRLHERILLDFPDEKFVFVPEGLGMKERVEYGACRAALAVSYSLQGKWSEAIALMAQNLLIRWIENQERKTGLLYGFPAFPFPDPFEDDPPAAVLGLAKNIEEIQKKGARFSPLIFVHGWTVRARWKDKNPDDALVSLNDIAYGLGQDRWRDFIQHDWKNFRFTLSVKGTTVTFFAESRKALVSGKGVSLRHKVERSYYDLYVPLGDLVKMLGGTVRPPKPDELQVFQRHLPMPILVVDLD